MQQLAPLPPIKSKPKPVSSYDGRPVPTENPFLLRQSSTYPTRQTIPGQPFIDEQTKSHNNEVGIGDDERGLEKMPKQGDEDDEEGGVVSSRPVRDDDDEDRGVAGAHGKWIDLCCSCCFFSKAKKN